MERGSTRTDMEKWTLLNASAFSIIFGALIFVAFHRSAIFGALIFGAFHRSSIFGAVIFGAFHRSAIFVILDAIIICQTGPLIHFGFK